MAYLNCSCKGLRGSLVATLCSVTILETRIWLVLVSDLDAKGPLFSYDLEERTSGSRVSVEPGFFGGAVPCFEEVQAANGSNSKIRS
jgi:hypothetical protein